MYYFIQGESYLPEEINMRKMTSKERVEATLNGELPDRVPVKEMAMIVMTKLAGAEWKDVRFDAKASAKIACDYSAKVKTDFLMGCPEGNAMFMDLEMEWKLHDDNYCSIKGAYFVDPEDVDAKPLYDPRNKKECPYLWKGIAGKSEELFKTYKGDAMVGGALWGPFTSAGFLRGVETMMMDLMLEPDIAKKAVKRGSEHSYKIIDMISDMGGDFFIMADPSASGDLINGPDYMEYVCAGAKRIADMVHSKDMYSLMHICGNSHTIIQEVPETGIDGFSVDFMVDMGRAKEELDGRCTLIGNVNPVALMWNGTPASIKADSDRIMKAAASGGKFMLGSGCETPIETPLENIIALREAAESYRY